MSPIERLRHHVTGAIDRGEATAITEAPPAPRPFGGRLGHYVTEQDIKASKRKGYNPYALGIMLGAAHDCEAAVAAGTSEAAAFADHFTPTRENHTMARRLGLALDVQRGRWVTIAEGK